MRFIGNVIEKLQRHPKRIVFPEGEEPRILQAARQFSALRLGAPILLGDAAKVKAVAQELEHFARRHPHHQSRRKRGPGKFRQTLSCVAPRKGAARHRGARGDAPAELLRHDDAGDAPGRRRDFRRVAHHQQPVAAALPNHQGRAGHPDGLELHGHGGRGHAHRRKRRAVHGGLRRDSRPDRGPACRHRRFHRAARAASARRAAARGVAVLFHQGQRIASVRRQSPGRDRHGQAQGGTDFSGSRLRRRIAGGRRAGAGNRRTQTAREQGGRARERADFSRPEFRQHRQQARPARRPRQRLRPDSARPEPARRRRFARLDRARHPRRRRHHRRAGDRLSKTLSGRRTRNCPANK